MIVTSASVAIIDRESARSFFLASRLVASDSHPIDRLALSAKHPRPFGVFDHIEFAFLPDKVAFKADPFIGK